MRIRAVVLSAVIGMCVASLATPASADPAPGSPGLGDPIYKGAGNGGYHVSHYDIRLSYDPATDRLNGRTVIDATTTQDLSQFNLDFALNVTGVTVGGTAATFRKDSVDPTELIVTPAAPVGNSQPLTIAVDYSDVPSNVKVDGIQVWHRTATGAVTSGQPRSAETWYPSNDHPSNKATYDVSVAVPDGTTAVSNGYLVSRKAEQPGWTRWTWHTNQPMVSYLPFIAVGKYEFHEGTTPRGLPYYTAYNPALGDKLPIARANIERTPEITDFLASKFGPYPFDALGGVAESGLDFAIENQTRPVYGDFAWTTGDDSWLVAHELAHQWFGDSVAIADWSQMWLNEGFAAYAEWLWAEQTGRGTAAELADSFYAKYPADDTFWKQVIAPTNRIFHDAVYERGGMTLQALRTEVGDATFFRILQGYHLRFHGGNARTADFVQYAERVSGRQLDALFKTWLSDPVKPPVGPNGHPVTAGKHQSTVAALSKLHHQLATKSR